MARIVVAGCGSLGALVGCSLAACGHEVFGLRRNARAVPGPIQALSVDLSDPIELTQTLPDGIDLIYYTAAPPQPGLAAYRRAYRDGLRVLCGVLIQRSAVVPIIFTSSTAVYGVDTGAVSGEWVDEDSPAEPRAPTTRALIEAEQVLATSRLPHTVVRLGGLYGPGRTQLLDQVRDGMARRDPPGYERTVNSLRIEDAAGFLVHLASCESRARLYLGVDDEPVVRNELLVWLAAELGLPPPPVGQERDAKGVTRPCRNQRLRASGYQFRFPTYREGYRPLLGG